MLTTIIVPLVLDKLLHRLCVVFFELVIIDEKINQWDISIKKSQFILIFDEMLANLWEKINRIFDLINLSVVYFASLSLAIMCEWIVLRFREHMPIHVPYLEERSIIGPDCLLEVSVISRPIIEVKPHREDLAPQKRLHIDAFLKQDGEVLKEQIARDVIVLEFHHVVNQVLHSFYLVVLQGDLHCICVVVSISFLLSYFDLINNWKFAVKELLIVLTKQLLDGIRIEGEY